MAAGPERWRELFQGAGASIFDMIEHAIIVAASDSPQEFRRRRDRIAEKLYTALATPPPCLNCGGAAAAEEEGKGSVRRVAEKESKMDSSSGVPGAGEEKDDDEDSDSDDERLRGAAASNYGHSYDDGEEDHETKELEELTNEIEEETQLVGEVLRIKELLLRHEDQSDSILFESLRRLQLMQLSVQTLKATEIGRAVNGLRKHNSQEIRHLVRTLIEGWKILVDEWVIATNSAIAGKSPDSWNPSVVDDEEGLPSPPLDEGAFFATQTTTIQLSEIFDGMDDDGNLRYTNNPNHQNKRGKNGGRPANHAPVLKHKPPQPLLRADEKVQLRRPELPARQEPPMRQQDLQKPQGSSSQAKSHGMLNKQIKPTSSQSGPGRALKASPQQQPYGEMKPRLTGDHIAVERKSAIGNVDKSKLPARASTGVKLESASRNIHEGLEDNWKLESAKRKLQKRYEEAENAKKQRTIQVMELNDIPKPKHQNRQPFMKSRNQSRSWANGRR